MSSYSKGKRLEKIIADELKSKGFILFFKSVFVRFHNIDFGPWDIVAAKFNKKPYWILVQCTSWGHRAERRRKCLEWLKIYKLDGMHGFLVAKNKEKEFIWEELK